MDWFPQSDLYPSYVSGAGRRAGRGSCGKNNPSVEVVSHWRTLRKRHWRGSPIPAVGISRAVTSEKENDVIRHNWNMTLHHEAEDGGKVVTHFRLLPHTKHYAVHTRLEVSPKPILYVRMAKLGTSEG